MDGGPNCVADDILAAVVKQLDRVGLLLHPETTNGHHEWGPTSPDHYDHIRGDSPRFTPWWSGKVVAQHVDITWVEITSRGSKWRAQLKDVGYNFQDGGVSLPDLRFADDVLIFAKSYDEIGHVLDVLVDALRQLGLVLNAGRIKKKNLTTQSQHPAKLVSPGGIVVEILERDRAHKWLACMISTHTDGSHGLDLEHHLQAASSTFYESKSCSSDKSVSIAQRLVYFDAIYTSNLFCKWPSQNLQTGPSQVGRRIPQTRAHHCGPSWRLRLVYSIAPHPSRVHARASECAEQAGVKLWSRSCLEQRWKLASYIANRSDNRWLKCALAWPAGRRTRIGRPTNTWDVQIQIYCRWQKLGEWKATAMQTDFWLTHMDSFIQFSTPK